MHWHILRTLHNPKKQPPRNVRIAVLKNFRKFPRVLFYFLLLKAFYHAWFPGNSLEFFGTAVLKNSCFWDYLGKLSWRFSVPQMQSPRNIWVAIQKKFEKTPSDSCFWDHLWKLLWQFSVPQIQSPRNIRIPVQKKFEKTLWKKSVLVCFF